MKVRLFGKNGECVEIGELRSLSIESDNNDAIYIATEVTDGAIVGLAAGDKNFEEYARLVGLRETKVIELK